MGYKLAGCCFIRRGVDLDYCFEAAIKSMQAVCDMVFVTYCESDDGTLERLKAIGSPMQIIVCSEDEWISQVGKEKLSYFQNKSIELAQEQMYEYVLLVQCDECLHEDSIPLIYRALELGEESYFISRHNLWGSHETMLNVRQNRKPVSTVVNRLAKSYYRSVDDGESLATNGASLDFINLIEIFHCGFIRDSRKHVEKIKEIQGNIFGMDVDSRVINAETFDPWIMGFEKSDVIPIPKPLPIYLNDWIKNLNK